LPVVLVLLLVFDCGVAGFELVAIPEEKQIPALRSGM